MRVHVRHPAEDGVVLEQLRESADVQAHREDQQQRREGNGKAAPRQRNVTVALSLKRPRAARHQDEENGEQTDNDSHRQQPSADELPCRKGKQIKIQGTAEDRIHHSTRGARRIPIKRQRRPLRYHTGASQSGDNQRGNGSDEAQNSIDRQGYWLPAHQNRVAGRQASEGRPLQCQKRSVQNGECGRGKTRKDRSA